MEPEDYALFLRAVATPAGGIVYDAKKLLADVAAMVEKQKQERAKK